MKHLFTISAVLLVGYLAIILIPVLLASTFLFILFWAASTLITTKEKSSDQS